MIRTQPARRRRWTDVYAAARSVAHAAAGGSPTAWRWRRFRALLALLAAFVLLVFALDRLFPPLLEPAGAGYAAVVLAEDGTPLRAFADARGVWRSPLHAEEVSPRYLEALLTYEDRWFAYHPGVNPLALLRACWQALRHGEIVSGGSTLTMQVARLLEPHERTVSGKLRQMLRALQLERRLDKTQILELYLSLAPFGGPLEGVEAAAQAYLGHSARELSPGEAALLAALPQAPSRLRPDRHPQRARAARDKVLDRLARFGVWPVERVAEAKQEAVSVFYVPQPMLAPLLARRLRPPAGGAVRTTLDRRLQAVLEDRLLASKASLPARTSAAVMVVENADLAVRAYAGSVDFLDAARFGHVDMAAAVRSPGSTLKPLLYGLALDEGLVHSESLLVDAPLSFDGYRPANFSGDFRGPVSVREALQASLNVPAVDLMDRLGPAWVSARLRNAGLPLTLPAGARPNPAMILGGAGARLEALVAAYAALARAGLGGRIRYTPEAPLANRRLLSAGAAWIVRALLEESPLPAEAGPRSRAPVAWKTGTSYGFRDAWALGVTDRFTVGVWIGRPDGTPVPGQYGAVTALPLLMRSVDILPVAAPVFAGHPPPASVRRAQICWPLGLEAEATAPEHCHQRREAWVLNDTLPPTLPERDRRFWTAGIHRYRVNGKTGLRVDARCPAARREARELARWPVAAMPWLPARLRARLRLPPFDPLCPAAVTGPRTLLEILGLEEGAVLRPRPADPALPTVDLRARGGGPRLYWLVNGALIGTTGLNEPLSYRFPGPGRFRITVMDRAGSHDSVAVDVRS